MRDACALQRTNDRAVDADNEWDTVPSIPRFTHTHYNVSCRCQLDELPVQTKRSSNAAHEAAARRYIHALPCRDTDAAADAHGWENDPVQPDIMLIHQRRLSARAEDVGICSKAPNSWVPQLRVAQASISLR